MLFSSSSKQSLLGFRPEVELMETCSDLCWCGILDLLGFRPEVELMETLHSHGIFPVRTKIRLGFRPEVELMETQLTPSRLRRLVSSQCLASARKSN